jgi:hypothetical protein
MRFRTALLGVALMVSSSGGVAAADVGFHDMICPEATQYVVAVGKLRADDPSQKIYEAAQAATDAYSRCSKDKLSNGLREPQHYADTRAGGFAVIAARALIALGRADEARAQLKQCRLLAQQVVDWQSETIAPKQGHSTGTRGDTVPANVETDRSAIGSDHRPSVYRAAAKDVVAAIDTELARIEAASRDVPRPQAPQPSPGH